MSKERSLLLKYKDELEKVGVIRSKKELLKIYNSITQKFSNTSVDWETEYKLMNSKFVCSLWLLVRLLLKYEPKLKLELTWAQEQVLRMVKEGKTTKQIAKELEMKEPNVSAIKNEILKKVAEMIV